MEWDFFNEVGRKAIHLLILLVLVGYFAIENQAGKQIALLTLVGVLALFLILEYLRLELDWRMPFFSIFIRPKEQNRMYGVIFFLSGTIIALAVFDTAIALAAILMTTFGDMAAAIFGKKYGSTLIFKNKTIIGFSAGLVTNVIVALVIAFTTPLNIYIPLIMAFTATAVETIVDELDDNLLVPIFAGFIGQVMVFL